MSPRNDCNKDGRSEPKDRRARRGAKGRRNLAVKGMRVREEKRREEK